MKITIALACCLLIAAGVQAQAPAASQPAAISAADLQKLAKDLEVTADKWLKATAYGADWVDLRKLDPEMDKRLQSVVYDESSLPTLKTCLTTIGVKKPANLYVINRLLEPLERADAQTAKAALPLVTSLYGKMDYDRLPEYTNLKPYEMPKNPNLPQTQTVMRARDEKMRKEYEVVRYNGQVGLLGERYFRTVVACNDPQEDKKLIKLIVEHEDKGRATWATALEALAKAKVMDQARATAILKTELPLLAETLKWQVKEYRDRSSAYIKSDQITKFDEPRSYSGVTLLTAINVFKKAAGEPQAAVPTLEEVNKHPKEPAKPANPPKR